MKKCGVPPPARKIHIPNPPTRAAGRENPQSKSASVGAHVVVFVVVVVVVVATWEAGSSSNQMC